MGVRCTLRGLNSSLDALAGAREMMANMGVVSTQAVPTYFKVVKASYTFW